MPCCPAPSVQRLCAFLILLLPSHCSHHRACFLRCLTLWCVCVEDTPLRAHRHLAQHACGLAHLHRIRLSPPSCPAPQHRCDFSCQCALLCIPHDHCVAYIYCIASPRGGSLCSRRLPSHCHLAVTLDPPMRPSACNLCVLCAPWVSPFAEHALRGG